MTYLVGHTVMTTCYVTGETLVRGYWVTHGQSARARKPLPFLHKAGLLTAGALAASPFFLLSTQIRCQDILVCAALSELLDSVACAHPACAAVLTFTHAARRLACRGGCRFVAAQRRLVRGPHPGQERLDRSVGRRLHRRRNDPRHARHHGECVLV